MFGWGNRGKKVANSIADHMRVEHNLFDTALMQVGVSWKSWKDLDGTTIPIGDLADNIRPDLIAGLHKLRDKWGEQPQIAAVLPRLEDEDFQVDIQAMKAAKEKMVIDPELGRADRDGSRRSERLADRDEAFFHWVSEKMMPGGMDSARILACIWAEVRDRAMTVPEISYMVNMPLARTEEACELMKATGVMLFGFGGGGVEYLKLNDTGLEAGRQISRQWLAITRMYPLP